MPLARGAIQFVRYQVLEHPDPKPRFRPFEPLESPHGREDSTDQAGRTAGWVSALEPDVSAHAADHSLLWWEGEMVLGYRIDEAKVPSAQLQRALRDWKQAFEAREARKPSKREASEQKELILNELRKRAFVSSKVHEVRFRPRQAELQIWSVSPKIVDEILIAAEDDMSLRLQPMGPGGRTEDLDLKPTAALFQGGVDE